MKKSSIIFSIIGFVFLGCAYYLMQKSSRLITESEQTALNIEELMLPNKKEFSTKLVTPDYEGIYYYEDLGLKQGDHIIVNNCMQYYMNDESFNNANKCEEAIVDAVIKSMGEAEFIKAIIGNMINYTREVSIKENFSKTLFDTGITEASLKSKLMLTFINRYRDPVKLQVAFNDYSDYFLGSISENLYSKLFKNYIDTFIRTYEEINEKEDKESFFKRIYYEAETKHRHSEFWNYTFWKRRELEKNDKIIYSILKEIKTHYER